MNFKFPIPNFQFPLILSLLIFSSCKKDHLFDCFKGSGDEQTDIRNLTGFTDVDLYNNVDLILTPGKDFSISITAGENLIDGITTEVKDNVLYIRNENKCNWVRSFKNKFTAKVSMPIINHLSCHGSGNISCADTVRTNEFIFDSWGSSCSVSLLFNTISAHTNIAVGTADLTLKGHIGVHYLFDNGEGPVHAEDCQTDITFTENKGSNDSYVYCTGWLAPKISFIGNIYYKGDPDSLTPVIEGDGRLIKMN